MVAFRQVVSKCRSEVTGKAPNGEFSVTSYLYSGTTCLEPPLYYMVAKHGFKQLKYTLITQLLQEL